MASTAAAHGRAHALLRQPRNELVNAHRLDRVFGRRVADRHSGRQVRTLQIALDLAPAVAIFVAVLDARRRAVAKRVFGFEPGALGGMQLAGGAVGVDVDIRVKRHSVSSRGPATGFKLMPFASQSAATGTSGRTRGSRSFS